MHMMRLLDLSRFLILTFFSLCYFCIAEGAGDFVACSRQCVQQGAALWPVRDHHVHDSAYDSTRSVLERADKVY